MAAGDAAGSDAEMRSAAVHHEPDLRTSSSAGPLPPADDGDLDFAATRWTLDGRRGADGRPTAFARDRALAREPLEAWCQRQAAGRDRRRCDAVRDANAAAALLPASESDGGGAQWGPGETVVWVTCLRSGRQAHLMLERPRADIVLQVALRRAGAEAVQCLAAALADAPGSSVACTGPLAAPDRVGAAWVHASVPAALASVGFAETEPLAACSAFGWVAGRDPSRAAALRQALLDTPRWPAPLSDNAETLQQELRELDEESRSGGRAGAARLLPRAKALWSWAASWWWLVRLDHPHTSARGSAADGPKLSFEQERALELLDFATDLVGSLQDAASSGGVADSGGSFRRDDSAASSMAMPTSPGQAQSKQSRQGTQDTPSLPEALPDAASPEALPDAQAPLLPEIPTEHPEVSPGAHPAEAVHPVPSPVAHPEGPQHHPQGSRDGSVSPAAELGTPADIGLAASGAERSRAQDFPHQTSSSTTGSEPIPRSLSDWPARPTQVLRDKMVMYRELLAPIGAPEWLREGPEQSVALLNTDNCCWINSILYPLFLCADFRKLVMGFRPYKHEWSAITAAKDARAPTVSHDAAVRFVHRLQTLFAFLGPTTQQRFAFSFYVKEAFEDYKRLEDMRQSAQSPTGAWHAVYSWEIDDWKREEVSCPRELIITEIVPGDDDDDEDDDDDDEDEDDDDEYDFSGRRRPVWPAEFYCRMRRGTGQTACWAGKLRRSDPEVLLHKEAASLSDANYDVAAMSHWRGHLTRHTTVRRRPQVSHATLFLRLAGSDRLEMLEVAGDSQRTERRYVLQRHQVARSQNRAAFGGDASFADAGEFLTALPGVLLHAALGVAEVCPGVGAEQHARVKRQVEELLFAPSREYRLRPVTGDDPLVTQAGADVEFCVPEGHSLRALHQRRGRVVRCIAKPQQVVVDVEPEEQGDRPPGEAAVSPSLLRLIRPAAEAQFPIVLPLPPCPNLNHPLAVGDVVKWYCNGRWEDGFIASVGGRAICPGQPRDLPEFYDLQCGDWVRLLFPNSDHHPAAVLAHGAGPDGDQIRVWARGECITACYGDAVSVREPELWYDVRWCSHDYCTRVLPIDLRPQPQQLSAHLSSFLETAGHSFRALCSTPRLLVLQLAGRDPDNGADRVAVPEHLSLGPLLESHAEGMRARRAVMLREAERDTVRDFDAGAAAATAARLAAMPQQVRSKLSEEDDTAVRRAVELLNAQAPGLAAAATQARSEAEEAALRARQQLAQAFSTSFAGNPSERYLLHAAVIYNTVHYWVYVRDRRTTSRVRRAELYEGDVCDDVDVDMWLKCNDLPPRRGPSGGRPTAEPAELWQALADAEGGTGAAATVLFYLRADAAAEPDDADRSEWIPEHLAKAVEADNRWLHARVARAQRELAKREAERQARHQRFALLQIGDRIRCLRDSTYGDTTVYQGDIGEVTALPGDPPNHHQPPPEGYVEVKVRNTFFDANADTVEYYPIDSNVEDGTSPSEPDAWLCAKCQHRNPYTTTHCDICRSASCDVAGSGGLAAGDAADPPFM